jgi:Haem-degrading
MTALREFTPLQGGVPIEVDGKAVGAIGVSGAANAQQDQEVALAGASAANRFASQRAGIASSPAANSGSVPVTYFIKIRWTTHLQREAFSIWRMATISRSLRVSAISPVHTLDADVIYVLQGQANFITRGTLLDGKTIDPNEIRGMHLSGLKSSLT